MIELVNYIGDIQDLEFDSGNTIEIATDYSEGGGTSNYEYLTNKPLIEGVELMGDKSLDELGLSAMTNEDILKVIGRL